MHSGLKGLATEFLKKFDICIAKFSEIQKITEKSKGGNILELLLEIPEKNDAQFGQQDARILKALRGSKSQLGQDLFVLCELGFKEGGYFVEFGATNGIDLSNTYVLEKQFGWSGIVAEPAGLWHEALKANRSCHIETDCVWRESNAVLTFNEVDFGEFSTIDTYSSVDALSKVRKQGKAYSVNSISLNDMLDKYKAPSRIDFLSIDTEGSEYEILSNFDFGKYQFTTICCEHNYMPVREKIFSLLTKHGYVRKFEEVSEFDDWFVKVD